MEGVDGSVHRGESSKSAVHHLSVISSCRSDKISSIFSAFDANKADIVKSIGFGGLLNLPVVETINNELCLWLYQRLDGKNKCLRLDGGVELHYADYDVNLVFGIPFRGRSVHSEVNQPKAKVIAFKQKIYKKNSQSSLTMSSLEEILTKDYRSDFTDGEIDGFKIACVLFSMCYFLAPEVCHEFPYHLIQNFVPAVKPKDINWADLVLWTLDRASYDAVVQVKHRREMIRLFGCTLFLQVFYLDNMNFGPSTPFHSIFPRASVYSAEFTYRLIASDYTGISDDHVMQFGNHQARQSYQVCYTRRFKDHVGTQYTQQYPSQSDYLNCLGILSEGIQLFDNFAIQVNQLNVRDENQAIFLMQATKTSYLNFRSKFNEDLQILSNKAVHLVGSRSTLNVFSRYNPEHVHDEESSSSSTQYAYSQKKVVKSHSNFPIQYTDQMLFHPDVSWENKYSCYAWMTNKSLAFDELNRNWIVFSAPKSLSITGHECRHCLKLNGTFTVSIVDAIMVLWSFLDGKMYNYYWELEEPHIIWRHFLPASFAEIVKRNGNYLDSDAIRSSFIGDHITYAVQDCQQIIAPVLDYGGTWSCYIWDFKFKSITVLDPLLMGLSTANAKEKHDYNVFRLHSALLACRDHFFAGWDDKNIGWSHVYLTDVGHKCSPENSGLYTVHYARSFYGSKKLAFRVKEPYESNLTVTRGEILYHFVTCSDNKGYKPEILMEKISYFEI